MLNQFGLVYNRQFSSVRRSNYNSVVLHAIKENFRCAEAFLLRAERSFYCFPQQNKKSSDKLEIPCGTKFLRVLIFTIFAIFPAIRKNNFRPQN